MLGWALNAEFAGSDPGNIAGQSDSFSASFGAQTGAATIQGTSASVSVSYGTLVLAAQLFGESASSSESDGALIGIGYLSAFNAGMSVSYGNLSESIAGAMIGGSYSSSASFGRLRGDGVLSGLSASSPGPTGTLAGSAQAGGVSFSTSAGLGPLIQVTTISGISVSESALFGSLLNLSVRFGHAVITVESQTGVQAVEQAFPAGSALYINAVYYDDRGLPFLPDSLRYRIDDVDSGFNIVPWTVLAPAPETLITVDVAENYMVNLSRQFEQHQVTIEVTDGFGTIVNAQAAYDVLAQSWNS